MSKLTDSWHYGDVSLIEQGRVAGGQQNRSVALQFISENAADKQDKSN